MPQTELLPVIPFSEFIIIQWKSTNKQCIESFTIAVYSNNGTNQIFKSEQLLEYEKNVTNLQPCTDYSIELLTKNLIGDLIQEDRASTRTSSVNPSSIQGIQIFLVTPSATIIWEKPKYGSTCVDYYSLKLVSFVHTTIGGKWLPGKKINCFIKMHESIMLFFCFKGPNIFTTAPLPRQAICLVT